MQEKHLAFLFAALTAVGVVVPYAALVPFLFEHGVDTTRIVDEITATRLGAFAWLDVLISALVLLLAAFGTGWISTGRALGVTLATCLVGVSAGLPLFFFVVGNRMSDPTDHPRRPMSGRRG
ncbi:DUF2834 domain-containing protein [Rhodococcus zopfii]|uniref:DUF2834 domain-containing protein n=1 Tax=Rhodococcus zopfii TaxID=43772 RepID=UPI0009FA3541|nr:DUF2834 domain-containing protein [Rhodococcus zopfii]